jgi:hypothetical protein
MDSLSDGFEEKTPLLCILISRDSCTLLELQVSNKFEPCQNYGMVAMGEDEIAPAFTQLLLVQNVLSML